MSDIDFDNLTPEEKASILKSLIESDGWRIFLKPHLEKLAKEHNDAAISRKKSPAERVEHIEAANLLPELVGLPEALLRSCREKIRE